VTVRIELEGRLAEGVDIRDMTLRILGDLGIRFASYRAVEYGGPGVAPLLLEERLVLANQGIEMGAKNAIVTPLVDPAEEASAPLADAFAGELLVADADARYEARHVYDLGVLAPLVARPGSPDRVIAVAEAAGEAIDRVWIGSCAGGRRADLVAAARVLAGKQIVIRTSVTPATRRIERELRADGTLTALEMAGCELLAPGCGACAGLHSGVAEAGERIFSTGTRNFPGRMGHRDAEIYLGSGYTAAATALAGVVSDPREVLA
jgi:homoaconitase/3-isopropylmalate dehydratase large subunit